MIKKDILCEHLWNHLVVDFRTQEFRMCCKTAPLKTTEQELEILKKDIFLNSKVVVDARIEMLQGIKSRFCQQCWDIESRGLISHRTSYTDWEKNVHEKNFPSKDLEKSLPIDFAKSDYPNNLDIQLGNICDLKCVYCSDRFSSSWAQENATFGVLDFEKNLPLFQKNSKNHQQLFEQSFWALFAEKKYSFDRIAFLGGEPLISPNFYQILDKLLEGYVPQSRKQELNIITNLNTPAHFFEKFTQVLPKLCEKFIVNINISMESWGSEAEYIRNGLNFDRFVNNFISLLDLKLPNKFTTITSLNILCLSTLEKYLRWVRFQEVKYNRIIEVHYNIISYPSFLSPDLATPAMHKYLESIIRFIDTEILAQPSEQNYHWERYLQNIKIMSDKIGSNRVISTKLNQDLIKFIKDIENRRGLVFENIFKDKEYLDLIVD